MAEVSLQGSGAMPLLASAWRQALAQHVGRLRLLLALPRYGDGDLPALKRLDRHRVQGSDPTHPVLAEFYDFLGDVTCRWVVYELQAQGLTHALQRK